MPRKRSGRARGRPRKADAKRRTTTRAGRRTGFDPHDDGTRELRERKKIATGRVDLPLDPASVLLGRELIDRAQFDKLGEIGNLMRLLARAWGIGTASPHGLYAALLAAASRGQLTSQANTPPGADGARRRLDRVLKRLDGSRDLVLQLAEHRTVPIIIRAWERRLSPRDAVILDRLRRALDRLPG